MNMTIENVRELFDFMRWGDLQILEAAGGRWPLVHLELTKFLDGQTDESLQRVVEYRRFNGEARRNRLIDLMLHVVNHGTYHRGQLNSMIKMGGGTPVGVDYTVFVWGKEKK